MYSKETKLLKIFEDTSQISELYDKESLSIVEANIKEVCNLINCSEESSTALKDCYKAVQYLQSKLKGYELKHYKKSAWFFPENNLGILIHLCDKAKLIIQLFKEIPLDKKIHPLLEDIVSRLYGKNLL